MRRKPEVLGDNEFDILVIGGGILGAAILHEATERGFKSALIEKGDFGQATSANSLKTIHGGLRYLQQADFKRIRQSIRARRKFMAFAPHLVLPQPFFVPVYGHGIKGVMTAALMINDWLSWDRNQNIPQENFLPKGKMVSRKECLDILPDIEPQGLTGGALWYDGQVQHTERLTLEFIHAASEKGAAAANYIRAKGFILEKGAVKGLKAEEVFSKTEFPIRARIVVNATGPWLMETLPPVTLFPGPSMAWVKGINVAVHKTLFPKYGIGLQENKKMPSGNGSRFFFFVPWHGQTMIGTAYNRYIGEPDRAGLAEREIAEFLIEINALYPPARLTLDDVSFCHFGLQPVSEGQNAKDSHPDPDKHSVIYDHESLVGLKGVVSVKSTKFTTAPVVAEKVLDLISAKGVSPGNVSLKDQDRSHYDKKLLKEDLDKVSFDRDQNLTPLMLVDHFWENYGPRSKELLSYFHQDPESPQGISQRPWVTTAEVLYGIREEMALKLSDMVCRRTNMAQAGCPTQESLQKVSEIMARELGWDEIHRRQEEESIFQAYQPFRKRV